MPTFSTISRFPNISFRLPSATTCPFHRTMIRSAHSQTSCISWVAITTVSMIAFISSKVRMISFRVAISRFAVGSSRSKIPGFNATPMARLARRIWPPERRRPSRFFSSFSRKRSSSSSVRFALSGTRRTSMA